VRTRLLVARGARPLGPSCKSTQGPGGGGGGGRGGRRRAEPQAQSRYMDPTQSLKPKKPIAMAHSGAKQGLGPAVIAGLADQQLMAVACAMRDTAPVPWGWAIVRCSTSTGPATACACACVRVRGCTVYCVPCAMDDAVLFGFRSTHIFRFSCVGCEIEGARSPHSRGLTRCLGSITGSYQLAVSTERDRHVVVTPTPASSKWPRLPSAIGVALCSGGGY
jgi:hypothetical protein